MKPRILFFLVPSAILIGFGMWILVNDASNYYQDIEEINKSKQLCNGIPCVCYNPRCFTIDDDTKSFLDYLPWGLGFVALGVIILICSRRWWK